MNLEKADIKIAVSCDLGARVEDSMESAKAEVLRQEGSTSALLQAAKACEVLGTHVDKDVDEGKFDLECATHVKRYLERATNALRNLSAHAEQGRVLALGKVNALETTVKIIAKYRDEESAKASAMREAIAAGASMGPKPSIKTQRRGKRGKNA